MLNNDRFYTRREVVDEVVRTEVASVTRALGLDAYVDMSAGDGYMLDALRRAVPALRFLYAVDIEPPPEAAAAGVVQADWLAVERIPGLNRRRALLGFNPPFGWHGEFAVRMVKHGLAVVRPQAVVVVLPLTAIRGRTYDGMTAVSCRRLPDASFTSEFRGGRAFSAVTFLVVMVRSTAGLSPAMPATPGGRAACAHLQARPRAPRRVFSIGRVEVTLSQATPTTDLQPGQAVAVLLIRGAGFRRTGTEGYYRLAQGAQGAHGAPWASYTVQQRAVVLRDRPLRLPLPYRTFIMATFAAPHGAAAPTRALLQRQLRRVVLAVAAHVHGQGGIKRGTSVADVAAALEPLESMTASR
jgi:hypothetical protein